MALSRRQGEIGVIASVTQAFCRDCSRARLSTDGSLYTCLFAGEGYDLRALVRGGFDDAQIGRAIAADLAAARRPLFGDPHGEHRRAAEGRDELHRRLAPRFAQRSPRRGLPMHVPALIEFLDGLARNNNRPWFVWNKPAYDILRQEFEELVGELAVQVRGVRSRPRSRRREEIDVPDLPRHALLEGQDALQDALQRRARRPLEARARAGLLLPHRSRRHAARRRRDLPPSSADSARRSGATSPRIREALTRVLRDRRFKATYGGLADEDALARPPERILRRHAAHRRDQAAALLRHGRGGPLRRRPPRDLARAIAGYFRDLLPLMAWLRGATGAKKK